jgi:hypothetical protein
LGCNAQYFFIPREFENSLPIPNNHEWKAVLGNKKSFQAESSDDNPLNPTVD